MCGYNAAQWIRKSFESALTQDYDNFDIICIDAKTNDGTYDILKEYHDKYSNFALLRNDEQKYQVENMLYGIRLAREGSVIVTLDFDDWLPHNQVLKNMDRVYKENDVWMTYGTYEEYPYRDISMYYKEFPEYVIKSNTFRTCGIWCSHLRTFKRELFLKIEDVDLRDDLGGDYVKMAGDTAFMYPMLEMAGNRSKYIRDIGYVYNVANPSSEYHLNEANQLRIAAMIRSREPYDKLDTLE